MPRCHGPRTSAGSQGPGAVSPRRILGRLRCRREAANGHESRHTTSDARRPPFPRRERAHLQVNGTFAIWRQASLCRNRSHPRFVVIGHPSARGAAAFRLCARPPHCRISNSARQTSQPSVYSVAGVDVRWRRSEARMAVQSAVSGSSADDDGRDRERKAPLRVPHYAVRLHRKLGGHRRRIIPNLHDRRDRRNTKSI
jgi:hypothetical protein